MNRKGEITEVEASLIDLEDIEFLVGNMEMQQEAAQILKKRTQIITKGRTAEFLKSTQHSCI